MAVNAYDVQICLRKMLTLSSKTCVDASINHPYISSSLVFSFLLLVFFPLVFWILVYSTPIVVCSCIALSTLRKTREDAEGDAKSQQNYNTIKKAKFASERVHSVRRRRAKEIMTENEVAKHNTPQQENLTTEIMLPKHEEEKVISSTNNDECVDKSPLLVEEIPKEIREVEQVCSPSRTPSKDESKDDEGTTNEEDHKNNVMDIGISDTERTKRLESLIARRRSRKMLSHQVRSLMNMDKNSHRTSSQMPSIIIPKMNKLGGPFSPGPGSAPSILIPMKNPFDLPYDPQEEKPVLTGDSFHQEFTSTNMFRDMIFSRHESFSLRPGEYYATSSSCDLGFRRAGYRFPGPENEFTERKCGPIMEQYEPKSDDDQIKEIIQNGSEGESESRQVPQSDFNTSSSSPSSSEEDEPVFKIDREAVLKSLSSMRRNALLEIESNQDAMGNNLSYANSALENATRLKQQYYDDKKSMKRHGISYSIASDMQVEVSEVSSPPQTIDDNMNDDLWANEHDSIDSLSDTTTGEDQPQTEPEQSVQESDHARLSSLDVESNEQQEVQSSTISPKSVLIPTLSLTNLDQDTIQEAVPHNAESSSSAIASPESINDDLKNQENVDGSEETSSRAFDSTSANDSEATSNQNAFSKSIDQSEDEMIIRESTHYDERQTLPTSSNCSDETKQVQYNDLSKLVEGNEANEADRRDEGHQSVQHTAESSSPANSSPESLDDEVKNQENVDRSEEVTISSSDQSEETSPRSIDATSANDSEAASYRNAFSKSIDQPEEQMVIRESIHEDERQTNSTNSYSFDETKQVQDKETKEMDHREEEHCSNLQGASLPETISSIDNDDK